MMTTAGPSKYRATLAAIPRPKAPFLGAIVLLVLVRLLVADFRDHLDAVPNGDLDTFIYYGKEAEIRAAGTPQPKVLLLGTSRSQFLTSHALANALNMPDSDVGSYGFASGNFWTQRLLLQRNPGLLEHCRVLIIECVPASLYRVPDLESSTRTVFGRYASLSERTSLGNTFFAARAVADYVFPLHAYRNSVLGWRLAAGQIRETVEDAERARVTPGTLAWNFAHTRPGLTLTADRIMDLATPAPEYNLPAREALHDFTRMVPRSCAIVFWVPPFRGDLTERIRTNAAAAHTFDSFRAELEGCCDDRCHIVWFDDAATSHFASEDYVDPEHFAADVAISRLAAEAARIARESMSSAQPAKAAASAI